jgi:predicted enzyme related to lactoylglutathione lyase
VEVKAAQLDEQVAFFRHSLGLEIDQERGGFILMKGKSNGFPLVLEPGGEKVSTITTWELSPAFLHPIWISFATSDIQAAHKHLLENDVVILKGVEHHPSWNGTDLIIADADGNAIQVVQYH